MSSSTNAGTTFPAASAATSTQRFARCIAASKRIRWDIDRDIIRGRTFDTTQKFLPDGLTKVDELEFLSADEKRYLSQIQGRTYANVFGLAERFVNAKVLELTRDHWFGDQIALEALVGFSAEELKHQELFRRIERLASEQMPPGYAFVAEPDDVAREILGKSTWAVLALTEDIELFTQIHYRESIAREENLSDLFKDVFLFHWKEESQHAIMDELEWRRIDAKLSPSERDRAVGELIELLASFDELLQRQAELDARYFVSTCGRALDETQRSTVRKGVVSAYRWQFIHSGVQDPRFMSVLAELAGKRHVGRLEAAVTAMA